MILTSTRFQVSLATYYRAFYHAHTLKGSSGYVGAEGVQWLATRMVFFAQRGQIEELIPLYEHLKAEVEATITALKEHVSKLQTKE